MGLDLGDIGRFLKEKGLPLLGNVIGVGSGGGKLLDVVKSIVGAGDDDDTAAIIAKLNSDESLIQLRQVEADLRKTEISAALEERRLDIQDDASRRDLIKVESTSEDPYVRRARPTFLYIMYGVMAMNFILIPIIAVVVRLCNYSIQIELFQLPSALYWLFGSAYLGYTTAREYGKAKMNGANGVRGMLSSLMDSTGGK